MPTLATDVIVYRPMSTPVKVELVPQHLPDAVRARLDTLTEALATRTGFEQQAASAPPSEKQKFLDQAAEADTAVHTALAELANSTASAPTSLREAASSAYARSTGSAADHIRQAMDAFQEAGAAAAMYSSVRPGHPLLRINGKSSADSPVRHQLGALRGLLQEVLAQLPELD